MSVVRGALPAHRGVDGGLEFAAGAVADALNALCVDTELIPPYQPNLHGKVERPNLTIEQLLLKKLPGQRPS